jgi:predicted ATPase
MELLYLRIFDTNTNHLLSFTNRDINFKPEHNFYYDEKDGKIKYTSNSSYNENLYGENTRVTGLIGGNGVGKSTLLKFLQYLIAKLEGQENKHSYQFDFWSWEAIINTNDGLNYGKNLILDHIEFGESRQGNVFEIKPILFKDCLIPPLINSPSSSIFYAPHLDLEEPTFDRPDYIDVSSDFLIYLESTDKEDNSISQMVDFRRNEIKRQIVFMQFAELEKNENLQFYKAFNRETISISFNHYIKKFDSDPKYIDFDDIKIYKEIDKQFISYSGSLNHNIKRKKSGTDGELARLWFYKRLFEVIYYNAEYRGEKEIDDSSYRLKLTNEFVFKEDNIIETLKSFFTNQLIIKGTLLAILLVKIDDVFGSELEYPENDKSFFCSLETAKKFLKLESDFLALLPFDSKLPLFNFDWQGMSTGEKAYLNLFSRIHYGLNLLDHHPKIKDSKKIYFLIDEPATGFHPQWQKEYLNKLVSFLDVRFKGEKHLIISSHSPFLVSDLQKEDVIALSRNNQKHTFLDNTFGANIHELLADSFFLNDGFIGDLSKNKILDLINYLTFDTEGIESEKNIKPIQEWSEENSIKFIDIIGEPLIKERLLSLFDKKFTFKTKEAILARMNLLENELKKFER